MKLKLRIDKREIHIEYREKKYRGTIKREKKSTCSRHEKKF